MMKIELLYPIAFSIFHTFSLLIYMFLKRKQAIAQKKIDYHYFLAYQTKFEVPSDLKIIERHFNNQFQTPIIFYITCLTGAIFLGEHFLFSLFSWLFVITRLIHTYIHLGSNDLKMRPYIYGLGWFIILIMWAFILIP